MGRILQSLPAAAAALALAAPAAPAASSPWATVNVCDTSGHPDAVGVRAWMPGQGGHDTRLQLRIRLQYQRGSDWVAVKGADSGWIDAGRGDQRGADAGQTFTVTPPRAGRAYVLRGVVSFRWRKGSTTVRYARRATHGGHPGTRGAEPESFSAAACTLR